MAANNPASKRTKRDYQRMRSFIAAIADGIASGKYAVIDTGAERNDPVTEAALVIMERKD